MGQNVLKISDLTTSIQTFYTGKLLAHGKNTLVLDQFAQRESYPKNAGTNAIRFFKKRTASIADVLSLTEGTTPTLTTSLTQIGVSSSGVAQLALGYTDATLVQYGEIGGVTDLVGWESKINMLNATVETMGEDAALHADAVTMQEIVSTNLSAAYPGTTKYAQNAASFAALCALAASPQTAICSIRDILDMFTSLKLLLAPKKMGGTQPGGSYVFVTPPQVSRDLMNDSDWKFAVHYGAPERLFRGETGEIYGCKVVETTNSFINDASDTTHPAYNYGPNQVGNTGRSLPSDTNAIFFSFATGQGAYGVPIMAGNSPYSPSIKLVTGADKADPFDQRTYAVWKTFWAATLYQPQFLVSYRCFSGHGAGA